MLDHLGGGRFEFGTGKGAGSHEIASFNLTHEMTQANFDEVIWEFRRMWEAREYAHDGPAFTTTPRTVLPKPLGGGHTHPALWVAAANPPTYARAAHMGLGNCGFNFAPAAEMRAHVEAYKEVVAQAEPVGRYANDNVMLTTSPMICLPDRDEARRWATEAGMEQLMALIYHYHDTFPKPEGAIAWPDRPPKWTPKDVDALIEAGYLVCGDPADVREMIANYERIGADQVAFGLPIGLPHEVALESIRCFGEEVLPHFDTDPLHRTTRMRYGADAEAIAADPRLAAQRYDSAPPAAATTLRRPPWTPSTSSSPSRRSSSSRPSTSGRSTARTGRASRGSSPTTRCST